MYGVVVYHTCSPRSSYRAMQESSHRPVSVRVRSRSVRPSFLLSGCVGLVGNRSGPIMPYVEAVDSVFSQFAHSDPLLPPILAQPPPASLVSQDIPDTDVPEDPDPSDRFPDHSEAINISTHLSRSPLLHSVDEDYHTLSRPPTSDFIFHHFR
jgi:hypothetical protein